MLPDEKEKGSPSLFGKKKRRFMGSKCCVPRCDNSFNNDKLTGQNRSYHRFPKRNERQRKLWVSHIRREPSWEPTSSSRICSDHFLGGKPGNNENEDGFAPTVFDCFKKSPLRRVSKVSSSKRVSPLHKRSSYKRHIKRSCDKQLFKDELLPQPEGHDYCCTKEERPWKDSIGSLKTLSRQKLKKNQKATVESSLRHLRDTVTSLEAQISDVTRINTQLKQQQPSVISLENIKDDDSKVKFWTGFPNFATFLAVFNFLLPRASHMKYWRGKSDRDDFDYNCKKDRKLSKIDEFFLVMIRLKVGLFTPVLQHIFQVSVGVVSSVFNTWINLMYVDLKSLCEMPSFDVTHENKSHVMGDFQNVSVIIDCTELFSERPGKLDAAKQMWSDYKHHITYKWLIGLSPHMGVVYVSRMYGGRASDRFITLDSNDFLDNLKNNNGVIMADRGFVLNAELKKNGIDLITPSFKGVGRAQMSENEINFSEKVARTRGHVERIIQRIKTYHILDGNLKMSMKGIQEQIFVVCAYLVNFQAPIVKNIEH